MAKSSLLMSAVESNQRAKGEKVAVLVPRVENEIEMQTCR